MSELFDVMLCPHSDLLYLTPDHSLVLETFPDSFSLLPSSQSASTNPTQLVRVPHYTRSLRMCVWLRGNGTVQAAVSVTGLSGGSNPIAMAAGYLRQYQSMVQMRQQVKLFQIPYSTKLPTMHVYKPRCE